MRKPSRTVLLVVLASVPAMSASRSDQWLESKAAHYTVFYQAGFEQDVEFTRRWLDAAVLLMKSKYGVSPDRYDMSVYLRPASGGAVNAVQSGRIECCKTTDRGMRTGTIDLLTRSSAVWKDGRPVSSLGLQKDGDDYHAKVIVSEYIPIGHYAVQDARPSGGWSYYSAPEWFVQGLQEYDAIFHSTDSNRVVTRQRLLQWAKANASQFSCCSPALRIGDAYNGGASFMTFLAAEFGEDIHSRLLRSSAPTFDAALTDQTRVPVARLFERFQQWLDAMQP